ncbi:MAG: hypothetical protein V7676_09515 [Parasphingorhabdus sp.]|uniref:hypothetical protein n=1 Tax=Parasphingorhabdus sp. TaxID=2709688 RepID=UPI003001C8DD
MGIILKYIQKNPQAGLLYYRRLFPAALRQYIPSQPQHLKRSLKATAIDAPGALARYKEAHDEYERLVALARKVQTGTYDTLDEPMIIYLTAKFESAWRTKADEIRWQRGEAKDRQDEGVDYLLDDFRHWNADGDLEAIVPFWTKDATALVIAQGLILDPHNTDRFNRLCASLNEAAIVVCEAIRVGKQNQQKELPPSPRLNVPQTSGTIASKSFEALALETMDLAHVRVSEYTRTEIKTSLRFFREAFGKPVPAEITRAMVNEWLELLAKRPSRLPKEHRQTPLRELVEIYEGRTDIPFLMPQTLKGRSVYLAGRWDAIAAAGGMVEGQSNPFRGHKFQRNAASRMVKGFSASELRAIFSLPIFTAGERPDGGKGEASYWLPLLMLTTGARPTEVAQLLTGNVWQTDGVWLIKFTDEGEHPAIGPKTLKTARTESGKRTFPVPSRLLDLKFIEYIDHLNASGEVAMFPRLNPKSAAGNDLHASYGVWWGEYLREMGILPTGVTRQPSKGFRHVWQTAALNAKVPREAREYIMGHTDSGGNAQRFYGDWTALGEYIHVVDPEGPDWSKVLRWANNDQAK